uniref:Acyl-CoA thioesterase 16 n=1 Tax=Astyanax mexicanus TaxID=7994 RepID=A0A8B9H7U9_ASTMX
MLAARGTLSPAAGLRALLSVEPSRGLVDEKFQIVVRNLTPGQQVTLHCVHQSEDKDFWEAFGHYISDQHGTVTVAKDASVGGTYEGVESMGLMWSLQPVPGSRTGLRLRKKDVLLPMVFHISVYDGHVTQGFNLMTALVTRVIERWYMAPGVQRVSVEEKGIRGTMFIPPGPGPFPGILDMWGGGGGLVEYRAALLASHGFVALALEYLSTADYYGSELTVDYFEIAYEILQDHPMVQRDRMALLGLSFGTSVTLSMAAYSKIIRVTKMQDEICISVKYVDLFLLSINPYQVTLSDWSFCFSLKSCSPQIERIMEKAGNRHLLHTLTYPGAGHLIEPPYTPHHRASNFLVNGKEKVIMLWGGQTKPHADAQEDSWEKILAFLQQHLYFTAPQARL